jgi:hypothetical protein
LRSLKDGRGLNIVLDARQFVGPRRAQTQQAEVEQGIIPAMPSRAERTGWSGDERRIRDALGLTRRSLNRSSPVKAKLKFPCHSKMKMSYSAK